jgi:hypothetical protein
LPRIDWVPRPDPKKKKKTQREDINPVQTKNIPQEHYPTQLGGERTFEVGSCRKETIFFTTLPLELSLTMGCIQFHTPLTPLHLHLKHKQPLRTSQLLWLSSNEPTELVHRPNNLSPLAPTPKALPSLLDLSASSAAKSGGDISVLLPTRLDLFPPDSLNS